MENGTYNLPCLIIIADGVLLLAIFIFRCPNHQAMPNTALRKQFSPRTLMTYGSPLSKCPVSTR